MSNQPLQSTPVSDLFTKYPKEKRDLFLEFLENNPHVWLEFRRLAHEWRNAGHSKCSAALIGNVLRWNVGIHSDDEQFALNNNWLPMLSRMLVVMDESFDGFFEFR